MKIKNKLITALTIFVLIFGICLSNIHTKSLVKATSTVDDIEFWTTYATEKIFRDVHIYQDVKLDAHLKVSAARAEYESGQIIMTAKKDIASYDIELNDLSLLEQPEIKFSKDNILLYNEKYISVVVNHDGTNSPTGMCPDALLPFDAAKKYNENKIKNGENQGLYVTFNVPKDQKPGVYNGAIKITFDGAVKEIPVTLTIWNLDVSTKVNTKSVFLNQWQYHNGELDSTQAYFNKYAEKLIEYRLAPDILMTDNSHSDDDILYYADLAFNFLKDERCSNITLSPRFVSGAIGANDFGLDPTLIETNIDKSSFKAYIRAFINKSVKENFDMLKKTVSYMGIIDEPQSFNLEKRVILVTGTVKQALKEMQTELAAMNIENTALKTSINESLINYKNIVTAHYASGLSDYIDTWCPTFADYDTEAGRNQYKNQDERWFYGCMQPKPPFPSYHLEDTLLSARATGWMQAEYDVVGTLFWATNMYASFDGTKYNPIEDYYGEAARFPNVNGDGYLFYPGRQYGIENPVASLRLEATRDGLEEYEILYALKNRYKQLSLDAGVEFNTAKSISSISLPIYSGTQVHTDSVTFSNARDTLARLAIIANDDAGFSIVDYYDNKCGAIEYKVFTKTGFDLFVDGVACLNSTNVNNGKIYTINKLLSDAKNKITFSYMNKGKEITFVQELGGKAMVFGNGYLETKIAQENGVISVDKSVIENGGILDSSLEGKKLIKVNIGGTSNVAATRMIAIKNSEELSSINKNTNKMIIELYYDGTEAINLTVNFKYSKQSLLYAATNITLKHGMNHVEVANLSTNSWDKYGKIDKLVLWFGEKLPNQNAIENIYFGDMIIYNV